MTNFGPDQFISEIQGLLPDVSRETSGLWRERLETYAALLVKWQKAINLVGPATLPDLWRRHMLDSAQLLPLLPNKDGVLTDFGSGAGFPGLVLAAMTGRKVHLIDSDLRKCAFLREAAQAIGVGDRVAVHAKRFDALAAWPSAIITARACAGLDDLLAHCVPFATPETVFLLLKGAKVDEELTAAAKHWTMVVERYPSMANAGGEPPGTILKLCNLNRRTVS
ncbi:16S rRNA (guanine(527)-N(7))-methyltransferase RsmG [Dongia soli]|uniref:Ribosomal RNA small subunit methyltransferase G n=1 Tax=Dongia soli TaxID=600628 RepID=A0ABU5E729_9PROT|nr:16S rRNA (guanine(527)-N(7))-methyltransferase RsmG [Dongia soli]MDY0881954.1 16S rRNA (guanine(527)-N(7))-methyltransferase RsmG [Dongia soli]